VTLGDRIPAWNGQGEAMDPLVDALKDGFASHADGVDDPLTGFCLRAKGGVRDEVRQQDVEMLVLGKVVIVRVQREP